MSLLSRREFAALAGAAAVPLAFGRRSAAAATLTAQDVFERIRQHIGVPWKTDSVDGVKAGDPSTVVTGVVTTSMATLDVLRQAVKAGANVVITAQPTFYAKSDARTPPLGRGAPAPPPPDRVFAAKNEFIDTHKLVVLRLSDHWKLRQPDPLAQGIAAVLGWTPHQVAGDPARYDIPAVTLENLVAHVRGGLHARGGIRVVGDPRVRVQRVDLLPGTTPIQAAVTLLPAVDVILAGEVREWETVEYVTDKAFAGEKKGLILVGRVVSEEPGMAGCAAWLKTFVPEVPVRHISAGDPYWRPA